MSRTTLSANTRALYLGRHSRGDPTHSYCHRWFFDLYLCFDASFCISASVKSSSSSFFLPFLRQPHFTWQLVVGVSVCVLNLSPAWFLDRQFVCAIMGPKSQIFSYRVSSFGSLRAQSSDTNFVVQFIYRSSTTQCQTCALTKCLMT